MVFRKLLLAGSFFADGFERLSRESSPGGSFSYLWVDTAGSGAHCLQWVWAITSLSWEVLREYDKVLLNL